MVDSAVNKLMHSPTTRLKVSASAGDGADFVKVLTHLFDLPEPALGEAEERGSADDAPQNDDEDEHLTH